MKNNLRSSPADEQSDDTILALLNDQRRRHAVAVLAEREPPTALRDLAADIAVLEADQNDGSADATDNIALTLHHSHLPKLDDAGVVDYDAEANAVTAARPEALSSFFEARETVTPLSF